MSTPITVVVVPSPPIVVVPVGVGLQGPPGSPGDGPVATAGETLGGHRCVVIDAAGLAWYASGTNPAHLGRFAGVTLGAATAGAQAALARVGPVTEPSWAWTPDTPVFLSINGLLTQTVPTAGFLPVIGIALSPTSLFINPREPLAII
jgi:hypothetical protein